jgi:hypothetical protein
MRTVLAGIDPIALDYIGAKHFIYPLSRNREHHDPDFPESSISKFLTLAQSALGEGALQEKNIKLHEYDFGI